MTSPRNDKDSIACQERNLAQLSKMSKEKAPIKGTSPGPEIFFTCI